MQRAYFSAVLSDFLKARDEQVMGQMAQRTEFPIDLTQRDAWVEQFHILREGFKGVDGHLFLEFVVPRIGSRVDAVVISGPVILAMEFKVGEAEFPRHALNQAWDYALDLKNFHLGSHHAPIVPLLVATQARGGDGGLGSTHRDGVYFPLRVGKGALEGVIRNVLAQVKGLSVDAVAWSNAPYQPTPTIVQAAQALYAQHSVEAISRSDAGAKNLQVTSRRIDEIVEEAKGRGRKVICFVTGVPGSGKTLVGLNQATQRREGAGKTHAVFLSGNGSLVAVLREALVRDEVAREKISGKKVRKGEVGQKVKAFIQNVHHFRDEGVKSIGNQEPPADRVVIFDEAQRAWNKEMTSAFMKAKKDVKGFEFSEPEFLLSYMDRHKDWAVVICLVGGGQEINRGEAGIRAWLEAVRDKYQDWEVYISPNLEELEFGAGGVLPSLDGRKSVVKDAGLHLAVSMRSFRAENLSRWVRAVLDVEEKTAQEIFPDLKKLYPMALTRDLEKAKAWVREKAGGTERYGIVASSKGSRLKPDAIDVRVMVDPVHWFLNDQEDTRSSYYLEDAATEFDVQGLELDWALVAWDGDFRKEGDKWGNWSFCGSSWDRIQKAERRMYQKNAYRVLLTRARQGMVIYVPKGESRDATRNPEYYNGTFEYLRGLGIPVLR